MHLGQKGAFKVGTGALGKVRGNRKRGIYGNGNRFRQIKEEMPQPRFDGQRLAVHIDGHVGGIQPNEELLQQRCLAHASLPGEYQRHVTFRIGERILNKLPIMAAANKGAAMWPQRCTGHIGIGDRRKGHGHIAPFAGKQAHQGRHTAFRFMPTVRKRVGENL